MAVLPPDTSLLAGTPADWTIGAAGWLTPKPGLPDNGRLAKPKALFLGHAWTLVDGRFVAPAGFNGGTAPAEHPLIVKLRAAGLDPDKLAAAMR